MALVTINVGGTVFQTQRSTLQGVPNTRLSNDMILAENFVKDKQHFFFDRDPQVFSYILNFYRTGELHLPSGVCSSSIKKELNFWMIPENRVSECCWKEMYQMNGERKALRKLNDLFRNEIADYTEARHNTSWFKRVRHQVWMCFEYPTSSPLAKVWEIFYFTLIVMSAGVHLLDSVDVLREPDNTLIHKCNLTKGVNSTTDLPDFFTGSKVKLKYILTRPFKMLDRLDMTITALITLEFIARFSVCPRKCQFMKNFLNIVDLIFIISKYPLFYMEHFTCFMKHDLIWYFAIFKLLTTSRLIRLFRIGRSCQGFKVMLLTIKASAKELFLMVGSLVCVTVLFAVVVYMAEISEGTFSNSFYACWWALITMTTVGYGDVFPVTPFGRIVGAICAVTGLVVFTLPIVVIGTNFSEYYNVNRYRRKYFETRMKESHIKAVEGLEQDVKIGQRQITKL